MIERYATYPYQKITSFGVTTTTYASMVQSVSDRSFPVTQRRKKPSDLFASATARNTSSYDYTVLSPLSWSSSGGPGTVIVNTIPDPIALYPSTLNPALDWAGLDSQVLGEIKNQKVNLTVSLAELGKTTDMVSNLARDVYGAFRSLRRPGQLFSEFSRMIARPYDRASRKASSRWLEYQYGWTPLAYEIYGLSSLLHERLSLGVWVYVIKGKRASTRLEGTVPSLPRTFSGSIESGWRLKARYKVDNSTLRSLAQTGISNPALVAWELVPYSFVVDWIIPIGQYLENLDALNGVSDLQYIRTYGHTGGAQLLSTRTSPSETVLSKGVSYLRWKQTGRSALLFNLPNPLPRYEPHLSTRRMVSSLALFRNFLR